MKGCAAELITRVCISSFIQKILSNIGSVILSSQMKGCCNCLEQFHDRHLAQGDMRASVLYGCRFPTSRTCNHPGRKSDVRAYIGFLADFNFVQDQASFRETK